MRWLGGESKGREWLESNRISSLISSLLLRNTKRISQRFRDWEASGLLWVHSMFLLDWKSHTPGPCRAHLLEHILPHCRCVYMKWDVSCVCIHPHAHTAVYRSRADLGDSLGSPWRTGCYCTYFVSPSFLIRHTHSHTHLSLALFSPVSIFFYYPGRRRASLGERSL